MIEIDSHKPLLEESSIKSSKKRSFRKGKDYLTIAAIGIATVGISFGASGLQQTFGVAAHSLVLLFSYLFII
jgi:hypothetical protein